MSLHRRNPRRDANEKLIVDALRAQGFHVTRISGAGVPDLLVAKAGGFLRLAEVKTLKGRFKPAQLAFAESWPGPPIITLRTVEDALKFQLLAMENRQ